MSHFQFEQQMQDVLRMDASIRLNTPKSFRARSKSTDPVLTPRRAAAGGVARGADNNENKGLDKTTSKSQSHLTLDLRGCNNNENAKPRNRTPTMTLSECGDRFIPNRSTTDLEYAQHAVATDAAAVADDNNPRSAMMNRLLSSGDSPNNERALARDADKSKILSFRSKAPEPSEAHSNSLKVLYSSSKSKAAKSANVRHVAEKPVKILDAPYLADDFYLHLADWSSLNYMAVVLNVDVFIWNATSGSIARLPMDRWELPFTSVSCEGAYLAVGDSDGEVKVWDVPQSKLLRTMGGHTDRVGVMSWNNHILATGSRSGIIHLHDVRIQDHIVGSLTGHSQEACGLDWSPHGQYLASGGNDNLVQIWDGRNLGTCLFSLNEHQSAIKAVKWCPWSSTTLATGGGTVDRTLKIWNGSTGNRIKSVDSGSQISSVVWNSEYRELTTGHGFSKHQLTVWTYPQLTRVTELQGHASRILCLAQSPDKSTVASVAGDETIRLWNIWPVKEKKEKRTKSVNSAIFQKIR